MQKMEEFLKISEKIPLKLNNKRKTPTGYNYQKGYINGVPALKIYYRDRPVKIIKCDEKIGSFGKDDSELNIWEIIKVCGGQTLNEARQQREASLMQIVKRYFIKKGYKCIEQPRLLDTTPDLLVYKENSPPIFIELKAYSSITYVGEPEISQLLVYYYLGTYLYESTRNNPEERVTNPLISALKTENGPPEEEKTEKSANSDKEKKINHRGTVEKKEYSESEKIVISSPYPSKYMLITTGRLAPENENGLIHGDYKDEESFTPRVKDMADKYATLRKKLNGGALEIRDIRQIYYKLNKAMTRFLKYIKTVDTKPPKIRNIRQSLDAVLTKIMAGKDNTDIWLVPAGIFAKALRNARMFTEMKLFNKIRKIWIDELILDRNIIDWEYNTSRIKKKG